MKQHHDWKEQDLEDSTHRHSLHRAYQFWFTIAAKCQTMEPANKEAAKMPGTYKMLELVGTSPTSFAEATKAAIAEAAKTVHHMNWFDVVRESGRIVDGKVEEFQVTVKIGFKIER